MSKQESVTHIGSAPPAGAVEVPKSIKRTGRPSNKEMAYINKAISEGKTVEQLAEELQRNVNVIVSALDRKDDGVVVSLDDDDIVKQLTTSSEWRLLSGEFSTEELSYFKHRYRKLIQQFKGDITATEETQVFLLIKFELLMNRNLKSAKRSLADISRLEKQIDKIYNKYSHDFDDAPEDERRTALTLESQLLTSRTAHQTRSTEFVKLQEKHSSILKELKATREQRQKNMNDQQHTFLGLLKKFQEEEWRNKTGKQMEVAKMAGNKAYDKLGDYHKYVDGSLDRPILSVDTVDK